MDMEYSLIERINQIVSTKPDDDDLASQLKKEIYAYELQSGSIRNSQGISALFQENMKYVEDELAGSMVIKSGFVDLDKAIGGFSPGELIVIGGRPSMGKTQLLVNLALTISKSIPVQYFTFDLSPSMLAKRFFSTLSGIAMSKILQLELTEEEKAKLAYLEIELKDHQIFLNDSCNSSVTSMKTHCLQQMQEHGVRVIMIDYLQMMSTTRYRHNRELELSYIIRELKSFAKDQNVCVIASSQLSRALEFRSGSKKPQLSDLRDSGTIEQDADKVIFIYRPECYGYQEDEMGNSTERLVELIIAKNRNGTVASIRLSRDKDFTTYSDFTDYDKKFTFLMGRLNEIDSPF